jgi:hypothetical protein
MPTLGQLRQSAKGLGIPASDIRSATSADELQALIVQFMNGGSTKTKTTRKPATKTRTATKTATKTPARRGRPPKAASKTAVKSKPAAKSATTGKAKRSTADESGRMMLGDVDFNVTDGWNAREGSPPDLIVKALRRFKGNRSKVFTHLLPNIWDFVGRKMQDSTKRSQASAETMLQYRISRTAWDFAMKTGQHEKSTNRAEYGTQGTYRKPGATGAARSTAKRSTTRKSTPQKAKPQKAAQKPAAAPKRRGRPPGSKNKPKVATTTARRTASKPVKKKTTARR